MIVVCFLLILGGLAQADVELIGTVLTGNQKSLAGVEVRIVGGGTDVTTSKGQFRIRLPASRIGQRVTLLVTKENWVSEPKDLSVIVPLHPTEFPIRITMRYVGPESTGVGSRRSKPSPPVTPQKCTGRLPGRAASFSVSAQYDPSGIMGDVGDLRLSRSAGRDSFAYEARGRGPHEWDFKYVDGAANPKSAQFGGVMYLNPPNNWGRERGFDLRGTRRVIKWEAHSLGGEVNVEFVIGGVVWRWDHEKKEQIGVSCPDSMPRTSLGIKTLTPNWQLFEWDLSQLPEDAFSSVVGAFAWTVNWGSNGVDDNAANNPQPKTFKIELRNIRYEGGAANERKDSRGSTRRTKRSNAKKNARGNAVRHGGLTAFSIQPDFTIHRRLRI